MKYYVVADVHGFYTELTIALTKKGFFKDKEPHKLIVCGDLFDRGAEPKELQDFILDLMKKEEVVLIRGNHEDLTTELVANIHKWMTNTVLFTHHWSNGTVDTVLKLTDMTLEEACNNPKECARRMQNTPFFKTIIPAMVDYFETKKYIFVHGWIPCEALGRVGRADTFYYKENWREGDAAEWTYARWYNGMEAARQGVIEPNKTIVCGHKHCSYGHAKIEGKGEEWGENADYSPYYGKGVIAIDACTAYSKRMNCIVIEE
jgi:serine/threonine protein phosphatase 1